MPKSSSSSELDAWEPREGLYRGSQRTNADETLSIYSHITPQQNGKTSRLSLSQRKRCAVVADLREHKELSPMKKFKPELLRISSDEEDFISKQTRSVDFGTNKVVKRTCESQSTPPESMSNQQVHLVQRTSPEEICVKRQEEKPNARMKPTQSRESQSSPHQFKFSQHSFFNSAKSPIIVPHQTPASSSSSSDDVFARFEQNHMTDSMDEEKFSQFLIKTPSQPLPTRRNQKSSPTPEILAGKPRNTSVPSKKLKRTSDLSHPLLQDEVFSQDCLNLETPKKPNTSISPRLLAERRPSPPASVSTPNLSVQSSAKKTQIFPEAGTVKSICRKNLFVRLKNLETEEPSDRFDISPIRPIPSVSGSVETVPLTPEESSDPLAISSPLCPGFEEALPNLEPDKSPDQPVEDLSKSGETVPNTEPETAKSPDGPTCIPDSPRKAFIRRSQGQIEPQKNCTNEIVRCSSCFVPADLIDESMVAHSITCRVKPIPRFKCSEGKNCKSTRKAHYGAYRHCSSSSSSKSSISLCDIDLNPTVLPNQPAELVPKNCSYGPATRSTSRVVPLTADSTALTSLKTFLPSTSEPKRVVAESLANGRVSLRPGTSRAKRRESSRKVTAPPSPIVWLASEMYLELQRDIDDPLARVEKWVLDSCRYLSSSEALMLEPEALLESNLEEVAETKPVIVTPLPLLDPSERRSVPEIPAQQVIKSEYIVTFPTPVSPRKTAKTPEIPATTLKIEPTSNSQAMVTSKQLTPVRPIAPLVIGSGPSGSGPSTIYLTPDSKSAKNVNAAELNQVSRNIGDDLSDAETVRCEQTAQEKWSQLMAKMRGSDLKKDVQNCVQCPFYKRIPLTGFAVDAFSYGRISGVTCYFLSHFHYDHYRGLGKWLDKPMYCSQITANLVLHQIKSVGHMVRVLPLNEPRVVENVEVVLLDANHCPGSVMFLFRLPTGLSILHVGDFRADASMEKLPVLNLRTIDHIYLDTTYCDEQFDFPPQSQVLQYVRQLVRENVVRYPKLLVVCGAYTIGKEKVFVAAAEELDCLIWAPAAKRRILECLEDPGLVSRFTKDPSKARLHVLNLNEITPGKLRMNLEQFKGAFTHVLALNPTGWQHDDNVSKCGLDAIRPKSYGNVFIYGIPYSEHSAFSELKRFIRYFKPTKIIPTVAVKTAVKRQNMQNIFKAWLSEGSVRNRF